MKYLSHTGLINLMSLHNYPSDQRGHCSALALMGSQAFLCDRVEQYNKRSEHLAQIAREVFSKKEEEYLHVLERSFSLLPAEFEGKSFLEASYLYQKIRKIIFDLGIWEQKETFFKKNFFLNCFPHFQSKELEQRGSVQFITDYAVVLNLGQIEAFLKLLDSRIKKSPMSQEKLVLYFRFNNHVVSICYDGKNERPWVLVEDDFVAICKGISEEIMAIHLMQNNHEVSCIFDISVSSLHFNVAGFKKLFQELEQEEDFLSFLRVNDDELDILDDNNHDWFVYCLTLDNIDFVKKIFLENLVTFNKNLEEDEYVDSIFITYFLNNKSLFSFIKELLLTDQIKLKPTDELISYLISLKEIDLIKHFILKNPDSFCTHPQWLFYCIHDDYLEGLEFLLSAGFNVNWMDGDLNTPLLVSCSLGSPTIVEALLKHKPELYFSPISQKMTAFDFAIFNQDEALAHKLCYLLLESGYNPNLYFNKSKPIFQAIRAGKLSVLELLHTKGAVLEGFDVQEYPEKRVTIIDNPLTLACRKKEPKVVRWLLERQFDPNTAYVINGDLGYPLFVACCANSQEITKLLLEFGANPNLFDRQGLTPLYFAMIKQHHDLYEILHKSGAFLDTFFYEGRTHLLLEAVIHSNRIGLEWLLKNGFDVNFKTKFGDTALNIAWEADKIDFIKILLSYGADPTIPNREGHSLADAEDFKENLGLTFPQSKRKKMTLST